MTRKARNYRRTDPTIDAHALKIWRVTKNLRDPRWTQEYVATWLGVSTRQYSRWENGQSPTPLYISKRIEEYESHVVQIADLREKILDLQADIADLQRTNHLLT